MAVKIRLKRFGKKRAPFYRIVVMDSRTKRDGRAIEEIGKYHPTEEPSIIEIDSDRAQYWLSVGAQPTEQVAVLLKLTGDWATFKGEKGVNTVQGASAKSDPDAAIKAHADAAEKAKAAAAAAKEAAKVADESSEVPSDEGDEVDVEIAEGNPSDADDAVEGTLPEEDK
ncbi:30S ribosomal protein S16 [Demequina sp.]|uniref:30S ribosomal protein S16 n=1 Tax=Demequina sp. TaxID=2050685 RepID=UPI0025F1F52E|nr:30S ribosomal protein S16 [Demequina sp.]